MKVLFFSSIAEITGLRELDMPVANSVGELKTLLETKYPAIKDIRYAVAVNRTIVNDGISLHESDEVALLPPFSGG